MKKTSLISSLGAAALALTMSATVSQAGWMQPGETMGVSLVSPLPEGVYFADLEDYGRSNHVVASGAGVGIGVNIPVFIWSTPVTFYNTRLEFLAAVPWAHVDGAGLNRVGAITQAYGPMLAHDFGGGLTGGIAAFIRTPDPSAGLQDLTGRTVAGADFRESLQYVVPTGFFKGITLIENGSFTSCLCGSGNFGTGYGGSSPFGVSSDGVDVRAQNDMLAGDFTAEKTFGKFTLGFTGYGNIDTDNRAGLTNITSINNPHEKNVAVGGLVGYDFGKFTLTAFVTRSLMANAIVPTVSYGEETRGWLRVIVPLYVAPSAPAAPVVARY